MPIGKDGILLPERYVDSNYIASLKLKADGSFYAYSKVLDNENEQGENDIIKTGMKLRLSNGEEYVIIVRGDIKEDGKITLTDLSKLIAHYNENEGMQLKDNQLKAADMNLDGVINLVDISQMIVLYNEI